MRNDRWSEVFDFLRLEGFDPLMTGRIEALEKELALLHTDNVCLRAALRAIRGRLRDTSGTLHFMGIGECLRLIDRVLKEDA